MNKDEIIKDLSEKLEMERQVKKHEVLINASYKETITRLEDQLKFVLKTNNVLVLTFDKFCITFPGIEPI